mgnify:FL=1
MKLTKNISFKNYKNLKTNKKILNFLGNIKKENNEILKSMNSTYKDSVSKKKILEYKKYKLIRLFGMGGSSLGAQSIYDFLKHKIKKIFLFYDNLEISKKDSKINKKKLNLIISKSGNTLETISTTNILINKNQKNIFVIENKKSYLMNLANKLKSEIIHHNNFIGGRYSVFSEVGMIPAELMGLNVNKFRQFNKLVDNKRFINSLISNVFNIYQLNKKKKFNSIILNYDNSSSNLFYWYQQLTAESLGKKGKGIFPIVSNMPKDNHSLMQLYLDGPSNNFYTLFFVEDKLSKKINNQILLKSHSYLKNKSLNEIKKSQFKATENIFRKKKIPFRSFYIKKRSEETLGELFTFFILETLLLAQLMKINPYDQPAVESIKKDTKKILINS